MMQPVKAQRAEVYLRRFVFWPVLILLLLLLWFDAWQDLNTLEQEQAYRAQRIADFLALSASQEGSIDQNFLIFQAQIRRVLVGPDVQSVRFVGSPSVRPDPALSFWNIDSLRLQRTAPVEFLVFSGSDPRYVLGGYLQVELTLKGRFLQYQQQLKQKIFYLILLLMLFWLILWLCSRHAVLPLQRLSKLAEQLRQNQPVPYRSTASAVITECDQIEIELLEAAALRQADQDKIQELSLKIEQLHQRDQIVQTSRDHFQSMITHELKSPLNAILGGVQLLQASRLDSHQSDNLKLISDGSYYLSHLLDQVLALLSLEQGRVAVRYEAFDPIQLLTGLAEQYQKIAFAQHLALELNIQHTTLLLSADVSKIHQVLSVLLDNAFKFTDQGSVRISADTQTNTSQRLDWICQISDTGIGIESNIQDDIFKPFFQADSSHNRQHEGAGVGLALAQRLTQIMGGTLQVTSRPQHGSQFEFRIPLRLWQRAHQSDGLLNRQMLVFETGLADELCQLLEQVGLRVQRVQSIEQTLRTCQSMAIDGVLICTHVPDVAIKKLLIALHQQGQQRHVVIRVVQATATIHQLQGQAWGIDHWLQLPTSPQRLAEQLERWIGC